MSNSLNRRLFLVSPRAALFESLGISREHPAAEVVAIITPSLPYETWFEGWRRAWEQKAKLDFIQSFVELWSSHCADATVTESFIQGLQSTEAIDEIFDRWWTICDSDDVLEIDDSWRPSRIR